MNKFSSHLKEESKKTYKVSVELILDKGNEIIAKTSFEVKDYTESYAKEQAQRLLYSYEYKNLKLELK